MTDIRLLVDAGNALGEGPVWDVREQALFWTDIEGGRLHRCDAGGGGLCQWDFPERLGSFALRERGGFVVALASGIALFDPVSGALDWIGRPDAEVAGNRFNDGRCDRSGRFWAGTMDMVGGQRTGSLFRLDPDLALHRMTGPLAIPNSLAWSPDGRTMYLADTVDCEIVAYDYDTAEGRISNRRLFATTEAPAYPDGSTVDADGFLWNAQWGGARLVRYAPDGRVDRIVPVPVSYPTSCAFGGADLATLYVTSAVHDLAGTRRAAEPWAGGVLAFTPGVRGLPEPRFAG